MLINEITNSGAVPSLEATLRFAGARQTLIAHNIANLNTPDFRPVDASPKHFQKLLGDAIDKRRSRTGGAHGGLTLAQDSEVRQARDGRIELTPKTPSGNVLFHDRNNRGVEELMKDQAENVAVFRVASELLRSRFDLMRSAIAERA